MIMTNKIEISLIHQFEEKKSNANTRTFISIKQL